MQARFVFYGSLWDFLPKARRHRPVTVEFRAPQTVKHLVEALGVPHPEVARIEKDGQPVPWSHQVQEGEEFHVYPFLPGEAWPYAHAPRFVADGHLGRLVAYLRLLGFDTLYDPDWDDPHLAQLAAAEERILLTRDQGLLKRNQVKMGYWLRSLQPAKQLEEVARYFALARWARPFHRCARCNEPLVDVPREAVADQVPPYIWRTHTRFRRCPACGRVYWPGSHVARLQVLFRQVLEGSS